MTLASLPSALMTDRRRPPRPSGHERRSEVPLSVGAAAVIRAFAASLDVDEGAVATAAFSALLFKHGHDEVLRVAIDTDVSGEPRAHELDPQVAWTPRTLVTAIVTSVQGAPAAAPCHVLASWRIGGTADSDTPREAGLSVNGHDVALACQSNDTGISVWIHHASELFSEETAALHAARLSQLMEAMAQAPDAELSSLTLWSAHDEQRLSTWNETARPFPRQATIATLLADQAGRSPASTAVVLPNAERLSYAELDHSSNQLARLLRQRGISRGHLVGLATQRGLHMLVAQHAILKAGAAYVPLDPAYPTDRIAHMVEDAALPLVITDADTAQRLDLPHDKVLLVEALPAMLGDFSDGPLAPEAELDARPADPAYVIYTSGSTGKPKGVVVPHGAVVNFLCSMAREPGMGAADRLLAVTTLSFDIAVLELLLPLTQGATVVLAEREHAIDGQALMGLLAQHQCSVMQATPSTWRMLIDAGWQGSTGFKALVGGEALTQDLADALMARTGELWNMYGPTETTVWSTCWRVQPGERPISIGRPIDNTQVHVLDAQMRPCPIGVPGELWIGGDGVTLGYLHRPELTAERFLADPFSPQEGARLYRTGDRGRWAADGLLEHLGRLDFQVKVRGHRIELGEIEVALLSHPALSRAVVIVREDQPGDQRLVAYVVAAQPQQAPTSAAVREHLKLSLPDYMLPQHLVALDAIPLLPNGKVNRHALPAPVASAATKAAAQTSKAVQQDDTLRLITEVFQQVLNVADVGADDSFFELGGTSLLVNAAVKLLRDRGVAGISVAAFFGSPTPAGVLVQVQGTAPVGSVARQRLSVHEPIAIVGMAGRFPGASDVRTFWQNLLDGKDSITHFSLDELDPSLDPALVADKDYVRARGVLDGIEAFDAGFFGITPREAELIDPQQRVFLEISWECLEHAGYAPGGEVSDIGVFAGIYTPSYLLKHVWPHSDVVARNGELPIMFANDKDYVSARVSHRLNLTGPAIAIHTACSTSLVAVASAVDALRAGRCYMALAGGSSITCPPRSGYLHEEGAMFSSDGRTRTFDAAGEGTVFSDGAAVVLIKRLSDALADRDHIHAVIRGVATNNDGAAKASFTAPSVDGQAAVILAAQADAGVTAEAIGYIEAHGTATPLGDPIEVTALTRAFRQSTDRVGYCQIGSVKSNVGHLITAAGAAGLIKASLALEHEVIPPSLHFEQPNPKMDLAHSPFTVTAKKTPWLRATRPRLAGISSFGVGGTNAHVVIEEAPPRAATPEPTGDCILRVSARTPAEVAASATRLADHLEQHPDLNLLDVAHTLRVGRKSFAHRIAVVAANTPDAVQALRASTGPTTFKGDARAKAPSLAFVFPGQGAQYAGMGQALYATEPVFRDALDGCLEALQEVLDFDLKARLFTGGDAALKATQTTQPALFCLEYATARLWMARGVVPDLLIGHSVGEFVAAALAGVMSVRDAAQLVAIRGAMMGAQAPGGMLSVRMSAKDLAASLPPDLDLAADNGPMACVVAGPTEALQAYQEQLTRDGVVCRILQTSHAFHSRMMDSAVAPFEDKVRSLPLHPPAIPIRSTLTGQWLSDAEATSPHYWAKHLRESVRFSPAVQATVDDGPCVFLEVGPRNVLATLIRQHRNAQGDAPRAVSSLTDQASDEPRAFTRARAQLWAFGIHSTEGHEGTPDSVLAAALPRRVPLPTYPFNRIRCWLEPVPARAAAISQGTEPSPNSAATPMPPHPHPPQETPMSTLATTPPAAPDRRPELLARVRTLLEDVSGLDMDDADPGMSFVEQGLDSLTMTQVAGQIKRDFKVDLTFRVIMEKLRTLDGLVTHLDEVLPRVAVAATSATPSATPSAAPSAPAAVAAVAPTVWAQPAPMAPAVATTAPVFAAPSDGLTALIQQQISLMTQQLAMLGQQPMMASAPVQAVVAAAPPTVLAAVAPSATVAAPAAAPQPTQAAPVVEDDVTAHTKYDVKKAFGAIARINTQTSGELTDRQRARLQQFITRYNTKAGKSKAFTQANRDVMADPRVVNGFRPQTKEITYQVVIERSKGSRLWDLDGNEYVDALSGFGMGLFGWQPDFVMDAVRKQLDLGYEIGPQHPLAADVSRLVCELTGHDRAGLCNTGSEAVMGAVRIARTVTGRSLIATFSNSYHGIFDEVIIRGNKKLRAVPAAPGIMSNSVENVIVLDYGSPESLKVLKERGHEIAAVLVEPVQSRRPEWQPKQFLKDVRELTSETGSLLIFDEVITGFRCHIGGAQALFGIKADLASYGKVIGGGFPVGVIAGKREYMDALDGGSWQYGDDSMPTVGVTYFAGTFVRHPLALAAAKASLEHLKAHGPALQERLNVRTGAMVDELNAFCREVGAPVDIKHFSSLWRITFTEDHPLQDLLFAMIRLRGVHLLDNFPCYLTTAHTDDDIAIIKKAFKESIEEMQESEFLPRRIDASKAALDVSKPPVPGARLGRDPQGKPAWYVQNPAEPGKFMKVE